MRHRGGFAAILTAILGVVLVGTVPSGDVGAQLVGPTTHTIFLTVFEVKGGTTTDKLAPVAVIGLPSAVTDIAAAANGTCARASDSSLWCWGTESVLGDGLPWGTPLLTKLTCP